MPSRSRHSPESSDRTRTRRNRVAWVDRRVYQPAAPELDGKVLPVGFTVTVNQPTFENVASQVELGGKARVVLSIGRNFPQNMPEWERDFLIVEDHLPAGSTLIEGSVNTSASSYSLADGVLTFYFAPDRNPGTISYEIYGYLPGQYRALPASVRSAYAPGRYHLGTPGTLRVRLGGEPGTDPYRPTPDELFARGKAHYDAGRYSDAGLALEPLFSGYTLRDDVAKNAATMLLLINIRQDQARKIVQYFEVVKEKAPELILSFDQLIAIGKAYRDINEYERAIIVWRGLIEASYLEDARLGELLRQRGETLKGLAYLIELWRAYPNTASIESDFFGLSQVVAQAAARAFSDVNLRREMAAAGITRSELLLQTIRLIQVFLSQSPKNPLADEASLALVGAFTELEDFKAVVKLASTLAKLYPKSSYLDSFQFSEALANFHLGQYDRAIEVAQAIARATYKDASGADQPSPNKWQSLFILGQIHDARRQPAKALDYYRQVADRFSDAASAVEFYTRKELKVPEIAVVRPEARNVAGVRSRQGEERGDPRHQCGQPARRHPEARRALRDQDRLSQHRPGQHQDLPRGSDAALPDAAQSERHRRDRPGRHHSARRKSSHARRRRGLRRQVQSDIGASGEGGGFLDHDSRRQSLRLGDRSGHAPGDRGPGGTRGPARSRFHPRFPDEGVPLQGAGQGDRQRQSPVHIGRNRPAGRLRCRRRARHGHGGCPPGRGSIRILPRNDLPGTSGAASSRSGGGRRQARAGTPGLNQELDVNLREQNTANSVRQIERLEKRYSAPKGQKPGAAAGEFR